MTKTSARGELLDDWSAGFIGNLDLYAITDRIHAIEDESWNAALAAFEEVVATQSGLEVRIDRELLPLDDATFAVPFHMPPATVTVTTGPSGQLVDRPALIAAIASLRKPVTP